MFGNYAELQEYVLNAHGTNRKKLNLMCLLGIPLWGLILWIVFYHLHKSNLGFIYLLLLSFGGLAASHGYPQLYFAVLLIYVAGWIHANLILSKYQKQAMQRINEINRIPEGDKHTNLALEMGLLSSKVHNDPAQAIEIFLSPLSLSEGDAQVLYFAGDVLHSKAYFTEARNYFDYALLNSKDDALTKLIKINIRNTEKALATFN